MKRFLISMVALLAVVGCAKQEDLVSGDFGFANGPEFEVGFESSRVSIAEDGEGFKLTWNEGDLVSCFLSTGGNAKYIYDGEPGADFGIIKPLDCPAGEPLSAYYAAYPYAEENALVDGKLSITLPAEQTYAEGTFGPNSNTMVSVNADKEPYYTFSNMCGYVRLKVWGEAAITSIVFQGNKEENIAGAALADAAAKSLEITGEGKTITLNCNEGVALGASEAEATEFWVVVPPMTFDEGFTVTLTDAEGQKMTKKLGTAFTVERNAVHEGKIEFQPVDPNILFDAKFNLDGTATDAGIYNLTIERKVDGAGKTPYMTTLADAASPTGVAVAFTRGQSANNVTYADSYYLVNYDDNAEFKAALNDGFTMEVVAKKMDHSNGDWMKIFSTNTVGLGFAATQQSNKTVAYGCANDEMNDWKYGENIFQHHGDLAPETDQYYHYMFTYNGETKKTYLYVNGVKIGERDDDITSGKRLAIGGYPTADDGIFHPYIGTVAVARIYDSVVTDAEAKAAYEAMNLKTPATTTTVLFDAKFGENGAATNVGTESSLVITPKLNDVDETVLRNGQYVISFNNAVKNNASVSSGYYYIDYSQNESFKNKLKDGFTMEVISRTTPYNDGFWAKPFASTTFFIHHSSFGDCQWGFAANTAENSWGNPGSFGWKWFTPVTIETFEHTLLTYDGAGYWRFYVNGKQYGPYFSAAFKEGNALAIGALPYTDGSARHTFAGEIAMTRIYDEVFVPKKAEARHSELVPTIKALNESLFELTDVLFDAKFNADGSATNVGSMSDLMIESPRGSNVITHKKGDDYVAIFNNYHKHNDIDINGFYYVNYATNQVFKDHLKDGFTMEVLCKVNNYDGDFWSTPFSLSTCRVHHNKVENNNKATWSLVASASENNWGSTGVFGGWFWGNFTPVTVNAYQHVVLTYDGIKTWNMIVDGKGNGPWSNKTALNPGNALAIGAIAYTANNAAHHFIGEVAIARIYDSAKTLEEVTARYNELKPTIEALNAAESPVLTANTLTPLVDLTFSNDENGAPKAIDTVSNSPVAVEQVGNGISVANGVASFNLTVTDGYTQAGNFKVDYSAIKDAINDGFTIEIIHKCRDFGGYWKAVFGNNGYSLKDSGADKWTLWYVNNDGSWKFLENSVMKKTDGVYYHSVYVYDRENNVYSLRTNGIIDGNHAWTQHVDTDYVMVGAAPDYDAKKPHNYWQGEIAMFRIYDEPANAFAAKELYNAAKAQVDALNQ